MSMCAHTLVCVIECARDFLPPPYRFLVKADREHTKFIWGQGNAFLSSVNHFGKMSLWTELPRQFGMFLLSALLSILAELAALHYTAKKTSGPIQQAKSDSDCIRAFQQIKWISAKYCHSFPFSCEFQREKSEPYLYCKSSVPYT